MGVFFLALFFPSLSFLLILILGNPHTPARREALALGSPTEAARNRKRTGKRDGRANFDLTRINASSTRLGTLCLSFAQGKQVGFRGQVRGVEWSNLKHAQDGHRYQPAFRNNGVLQLAANGLAAWGTASSSSSSS